MAWMHELLSIFPKDVKMNNDMSIESGDVEASGDIVDLATFIFARNAVPTVVRLDLGGPVDTQRLLFFLADLYAFGVKAFNGIPMSADIPVDDLDPETVNWMHDHMVVALSIEPMVTQLPSEVVSTGGGTLFAIQDGHLSECEVYNMNIGIRVKFCPFIGVVHF